MMRSYWLRNALVFCVPACLLLTSCSPAQSGGDFSPQLDESYAVQAEMEYAEGLSAQLSLTRYGSELWEAAFTEPASLAGVVLTFDGNTVSASYKGLEFTVPKSALAAKNMLLYITDALNAAAAADQLPCSRLEDGSWVCSGDSDGGCYSLSFAENGQPLRFELPAQPLTVSFSAYTALDAPAVTDISTFVTIDATTAGSVPTASESTLTSAAESTATVPATECAQ